MGAMKNWAEVGTRYLLGLLGHNSRIPGSPSSQSTSAIRPPYKGSKTLNPGQIGQTAQKIEDTYHPGFFVSGSGTRKEQARQESVRQLNREGSYEERAKKGTRLPT